MYWYIYLFPPLGMNMSQPRRQRHVSAGQPNSRSTSPFPPCPNHTSARVLYNNPQAKTLVTAERSPTNLSVTPSWSSLPPHIWPSTAPPAHFTSARSKAVPWREKTHNVLVEAIRCSDNRACAVGGPLVGAAP